MFPKNSDGAWRRDRDQLMAMLAALPVEGILSYEEAERQIGRSRRWLSQVFFDVKKRLAKDRLIVIGCMREVGWRRLSDTAVVDHGRHDIRKGRRHFTRAKHRCQSVKVENLSREQAVYHEMQLSVIEMIHSSSTAPRKMAVQKKMANSDIDVGTINPDNFSFD